MAICRQVVVGRVKEEPTPQELENDSRDEWKQFGESGSCRDFFISEKMHQNRRSSSTLLVIMYHMM